MTVALSQEQWMAINETVLAVYRCEDLDELRTRFLRDLEKLIIHEKSWFDLANRKDNWIVFYDPVSNNMTEQEVNDYYDKYQASDYVPWSFINNEAITYRDSDILSNPLREQTYFYQNWLKPMGVYYGMGSTLVENGMIYGSITLFRSKERDDFTDQELFILDTLSRHIEVHFRNLYPNGFSSKTSTSPIDNHLINKYHITEREHEVIRLICQGLSNQDISEALSISQNTVKKHINNLFHKMNVDSRFQLLNLVLKNS